MLIKNHTIIACCYPQGGKQCNTCYNHIFWNYQYSSRVVDQVNAPMCTISADDPIGYTFFLPPEDNGVTKKIIEQDQEQQALGDSVTYLIKIGI